MFVHRPLFYDRIRNSADNMWQVTRGQRGRNGSLWDPPGKNNTLELVITVHHIPHRSMLVVGFDDRLWELKGAFNVAFD
ncbi:MAG: hypothetical protein NTZ04_01200 [Chloroflexi bacterium]|nr:hypothetical protein [Chloroflexota bacterium]